MLRLPRWGWGSIIPVLFLLVLGTSGCSASSKDFTAQLKEAGFNQPITVDKVTEGRGTKAETVYEAHTFVKEFPNCDLEFDQGVTWPTPSYTLDKVKRVGDAENQAVELDDVSTGGFLSNLSEEIPENPTAQQVTDFLKKYTKDPKYKSNFPCAA